MIEIDDEVWDVFKSSWALLGVREHRKLVAMLEDQLYRESQLVLLDAEQQLIDDTPEAYVRREIGLEKSRRKHLCSTTET